MAGRTAGETNCAAPLLRVQGLTLTYARRSPLGERSAVAALQDVSLELFAGETLALLGKSGSGKSSLARCLVLVERPECGEIIYRGEDLLKLGREELKKARREIHLIFQDSAAALNPGLTVEEILREPLAVHEPAMRGAETAARIREVMVLVEMQEKWLKRRPLELSGGQRQRVAIARALAVPPKLVILDEALSALDLSAQGQIANLLMDLQKRFALAYLFISHDEAMAGAMATRAARMSKGRIVRQGAAAEVLTGNLQAGSGTFAAEPVHERL